MDKPGTYDSMAEQVRAMANVQDRPCGANGKPSRGMVDAIAAMRACVAELVHAFPDKVPVITACAPDRLIEEL